MSWDNEHWSSPNGCHQDCPACEAELTDEQRQADQAEHRLAKAAPDLAQFARDYLWSAHGECPMTREACCQTNEQLRDMARAALEIVEGGGQ